jgi:hypothetical protein
MPDGLKPLPIINASGALPDAHTGDAYAYEVDASRDPYYYEATGLPVGLSVDRQTGELATNSPSWYTVCAGATHFVSISSSTARTVCTSPIDPPA